MELHCSAGYASSDRDCRNGGVGIAHFDEAVEDPLQYAVARIASLARLKRAFLFRNGHRGRYPEVVEWRSRSGFQDCTATDGLNVLTGTMV